MHITLSPQRRDDTLAVSRQDDTLTINGEAFNLNGLDDGDIIPAGTIPCDWIIGPVERKNGKVHLTLILPHGPNPNQAVAFPEPIIDPPNGPIDLPRDPKPEEPDDVEP